MTPAEESKLRADLAEANEENFKLRLDAETETGRAERLIGQLDQELTLLNHNWRLRTDEPWRTIEEVLRRC